MPRRGRRRGRNPSAQIENAEEDDAWRKGRCFGAYRCPTCNRLWMSANSWAIYGQKCFKCKKGGYVLPFDLKPLDKPEGLDKNDRKKPHPFNLCQKCVVLGYYCRNKQRNRAITA